MIIPKTCNTCKHYPNDKQCISCEWDKDKRENTKWELKKNPELIERAVLDEIRAEIQKVINAERDFTSERAQTQAIALNWCLDIIDKYTKE